MLSPSIKMNRSVVLISAAALCAASDPRIPSTRRAQGIMLRMRAQNSSLFGSSKVRKITSRSAMSIFMILQAPTQSIAAADYHCNVFGMARDTFGCWFQFRWQGRRWRDYLVVSHQHIHACHRELFGSDFYVRSRYIIMAVAQWPTFIIMIKAEIDWFGIKPLIRLPEFYKNFIIVQHEHTNLSHDNGNNPTGSLC